MIPPHSRAIVIGYITLKYVHPEEAHPSRFAQHSVVFELLENQL